MRRKKAQGWGFDLIIAGTIFLIGIITFYLYSLNYPKEGQETLDVLFYEGNFIADSLLSNGFPDSWNSTNVIKIGLTNNNKINQTKLENFYNLSTEDYQKTKAVFNTRYNYFFNLSEQITLPNIGNINGIGLSFQGQNPKNLIKITRISIYQNKSVTLNVYIWE